MQGRIDPKALLHVRRYLQLTRQRARVADIQDVLGHSSDKMARHYAGQARQAAAADIMARYSLAN
jgi:integrase